MYSLYCESQIESFKVPSVGWKNDYPEVFSICLIQNFIKPHKISAHSDNLETCLNELNELNFSEVSRNSLSNRC